MAAANIFLLGFGALTIVPIILLFVETKKRLGFSRATLTVTALIGFIFSAFFSIRIFGIWIVLLFPILLFLGLFILKKSPSKQDTLDKEE